MKKFFKTYKRERERVCLYNLTETRIVLQIIARLTRAGERADRVLAHAVKARIAIHALIYILACLIIKEKTRVADARKGSFSVETLARSARIDQTLVRICVDILKVRIRVESYHDIHEVFD